jgi:hypothetical protein
VLANLLTGVGLTLKLSRRIREDARETAIAKRTTANGRSKRLPWTTNDLRELKQHSKSKTPLAKIAKAMKRSEGAIRQKAMGLDLPLGHRR